MSEIGYGPLWRVDGPPPVARTYGLLQAGEAAAAGVRIIPDQDADGVDRWANGIEVFPYPVDVAEAFDPCASGTGPNAAKAEGQDVPRPQFAAVTVFLPVTCTAYRIWDQAEFKARAVAAMATVEGARVERELLAGDVMLLNPHLADGQGTFPNADGVTSVVNGVALLEGELAASARGGLIHLSPQAGTVAVLNGLIEPADGVLRTKACGTLVICGAGYAAGASPAGHAVATGTQEWIYATGPVDVRRSEVFVVPESVAEALDRGAGGAANSITYRAERYYVVAWDTAVQAAVLVDRCQNTCT